MLAAAAQGQPADAQARPASVPLPPTSPLTLASCARSPPAQAAAGAACAAPPAQPAAAPPPPSVEQQQEALLRAKYGGLMPKKLGLLAQSGRKARPAQAERASEPSTEPRVRSPPHPQTGRARAL